MRTSPSRHMLPFVRARDPDDSRPSRASERLRDALSRELARYRLPSAPADLSRVTQAELDPLPAAARRYMLFMGVVDRPRDWSLRVSFEGRFRLNADAPWRPCVAWQYTSAVDPARLFYMNLRMGNGLLPIIGRDTYVGGVGAMRIRPFDLFTIVHARGREFDIGELVTYLNDAILLAPSMLLTPRTTWREVDDDAFEVTLRDHASTVTARVFLDKRGAVHDFITDDRYYATGRQPPKRMRWSTPVRGWSRVLDRPVPTSAQAIWQLPRGPVPYADFRLVRGSLAFNVPPGA